MRQPEQDPRLAQSPARAAGLISRPVNACQNCARYEERMARGLGVLQKLFGVDEVGDDPTDYFILVEEMSKRLAARSVSLVVPPQDVEFLERLYAVAIAFNERNQILRCRWCGSVSSGSPDVAGRLHKPDCIFLELAERIERLRLASPPSPEAD